jgi:hypothetical protein
LQDAEHGDLVVVRADEQGDVTGGAATQRLVRVPREGYPVQDHPPGAAAGKVPGADVAVDDLRLRGQDGLDVDGLQVLHR